MQKQSETYIRMKEYLVHKADLDHINFTGSYRQEIARRMHCSVKAVDRYAYGNCLIAEFQTLIKHSIVGLSSLEEVSSQPENSQANLYLLFKGIQAMAKSLGIKKKILCRENCKTIANKYIDGIRTVEEIWPHLVTSTPRGKGNNCNNGTTPPQPPTLSAFDKAIIQYASKKEKGDYLEHYTLSTLMAKGYTVEETKSCKDHGADIILVKDGIRYAVQCKYIGTKDSVPKATCYAIFWALFRYNCSVGIVVSNGKFGPDIRTAAAEQNILLLTIADLEAL